MVDRKITAGLAAVVAVITSVSVTPQTLTA